MGFLSNLKEVVEEGIKKKPVEVEYKYQKRFTLFSSIFFKIQRIMDEMNFLIAFL